MANNRLKTKIILIVCDGMGDLPSKELNKKTPLEAAKTPNMDKMAKNGFTGIMNVLEKGIIPSSDRGHLALFGYEFKKNYIGRGPIEALGIKMHLKHGDVAFRGNMATVDQEWKILDRRAGRIKNVKKLAKSLNGMKIRGIHFSVKAGTSHRVAIVMHGPGLSAKVSDSDPHKEGKKVQKVKPLNKTKKAIFTAEVLNEFLEKAHKKLLKHPLNKERIKKGLPPANFVLTRGAGQMKKLKSFKEKHHLKACCIAGGGLYKGVAALVGMKVIEVKGATGTPNTNIKAKIARAIKEINSNCNFVFVHIKGTDIFGHDGDCKGKKKFIEKIDAAIKPLLSLNNTTIALTADHSTPCSKKDHSADPVPVVIWRKGLFLGNEKIKHFNERECIKGNLGRIQGIKLMQEIKRISKLKPRYV